VPGLHGTRHIMLLRRAVSTSDLCSLGAEPLRLEMSPSTRERRCSLGAEDDDQFGACALTRNHYAGFSAAEECEAEAARTQILLHEERQALTVRGNHAQSWHFGCAGPRPGYAHPRPHSGADMRRSSFASTLLAFLRNMRVNGKEPGADCPVRAAPARALNHDIDFDMASRVAPSPSPSPSQLLDLLPDHLKAECITRMKHCRYRKGQNIVRLGELGSTLFIIEEGSAQASLHGHHLQSLQRGSFFGMCDVAAQTDCECWTLSEWDFAQVLGQNTKDTAEIMQALAKVSAERLARIREAQECAMQSRGAGSTHIRPPRHVAQIFSRCVLAQMEAQEHF
jgi:CRP-like cAMP-binding protein